MCDSTAIKAKKGKRSLQLKQQAVTTPVIEYFECESCGEVFYPPKTGKQLDKLYLTVSQRKVGRPESRKVG